MRLLISVLIVSLSLGMAGCVDRASVSYGDNKGDGYKQGPPPHAPAHGYRAKHGNHDLRYDGGLGAYVVLGYDNHFYLDNAYFRYREGNWQISAQLDDGWKHVDDYRVPVGLRSSKQYKKYDDHPGKGKGKEKKKDRY
jgi:hypothetical protein